MSQVAVACVAIIVSGCCPRSRWWLSVCLQS